MRPAFSSRMGTALPAPSLSMSMRPALTSHERRDACLLLGRHVKMMWSPCAGTCGSTRRTTRRSRFGHDVGGRMWAHAPATARGCVAGIKIMSMMKPARVGCAGGRRWGARGRRGHRGKYLHEMSDLVLLARRALQESENPCRYSLIVQISGLQICDSCIIIPAIIGCKTPEYARLRTALSRFNG